MAKCLGSLVWPCDHAEKHSEAAKKGWLHRRAGASFAGTREHTALSALFGEEISHAHEDPSHKGMIRFKHGGSWYELPRRSFQNLVHEGEQLQRDQARAERKAQKNSVQEERVRQAQQRQLTAAHQAEYQNVVRTIRAMGGIRPYQASSAGKGKNPELEEWRDLPKGVKTRDPRKGWAMDEMAETINEQYPWLKIRDDTDLRAYLTNKKNRRPGDAWYGAA